MKTSQTDIELIERYLDDELSAAEASGFFLRVEADAAFGRDIEAQTIVRTLVRKHHFFRLKRKAQELHRRLYHDPARRSFRQAIEAIFKQ